MKFGHFDDKAREYVIETPRTHGCAGTVASCRVNTSAMAVPA